ncbi:Secreted protein OS=Streptomyces microflavus OX=1919 GN=Smic_09890 PE=4 SV=1 [Streptomyces microflavus]
MPGVEARLAAWRFLIRSEGRAIAAADTMLTPDGWSFSHFFEGPYLASTELAVRQAEASPTAYQARLLSIPELYMLTLWLHDSTEDDASDASGGVLAPADVLVPLAPAPPGIAAHRPHRVADLLPVMTLRVAPGPLLSSA